MAILSPEWIVARVLKRENQEVEIYVTFRGSIPIQPSFTIESLVYRVTPTRVDIAPTQMTDELIRASESAANALLTELLHTPVKALGLNLRFTAGEYDPRSLARLDAGNDLGSIPSADEITRTEIKTTYKVSGNIPHLFNISHIFSAENGYEIDFNFHYELTSAVFGAEVLVGNRFINARDTAVKVLHQMFDFEKLEIAEDNALP